MEEIRTYYVDAVFCIDGTKCMATYMPDIKDAIKNLPQRMEILSEKGKWRAGALRIKIIVFRDYTEKYAPPMEETKFFTIPDEMDALCAFVDGIEVAGVGSQNGRSALEAIALAIKSDWTAKEKYKRNIIIPITENAALPLQTGADSSEYPEGMPKTLGELGAWWEGVDANFVGSYKPNAGRLLVFAPNVEPWMELAAWNRYWHTPIDSVFGVEEEFGETLADLLFGV